jgi:hypothetical protein
MWLVVEIALVMTVIYIPLGDENYIFGEATRFFGEWGEGLGFFYNFLIYLQGVHATSFSLFLVSKYSKRIRKWAAYAEAKIILSSVGLLLYHHVMCAIVSGWPLFHVIFWLWVGILTSLSVKMYASYNSLNFLNL